MAEDFTILLADGVSTERLNEALDTIWRDLALNGSGGISSADRNPFLAERNEAQIGIAETIAVAFLGGIAREAAVSVWKEYIWPAVKAKFGPDIAVAENAG